MITNQQTVEFGQESFNKLLDENTTVREFNSLNTHFENHAKEIWQYICHKSDRFTPDVNVKIGPTTVEVEGKNGEVYDFFYTIVGDFETKENEHYPFQIGFPVKLLWANDWKEIVDRTITSAIETYTVERLSKLQKKRQKKQEKKIRDKERLFMNKNCSKALTKR